MTKTSINLQDLKKRIAVKAKAEPEHRFWGLYCHVWKLNVLEEAYRVAKRSGGSHGSDGITFSAIEKGIGSLNLIRELSQELKGGTYRPLEPRKVRIPKSNGKFRQLKIPAIRDRVVQGAIKLVTEPIFEMDFQPGSFGYRPRRSAHHALERVRTGLSRCLTRVIDLDLKSFFDQVCHDRLLAKLAERIDDDQMLRLFKLILKSSGKRGLPQGSIVGPLWANVFLNELDEMLEQAQTATESGRYELIRYVRFADDLIVLVSNSKQAEQKQWLEKVEHRIRQVITNLGLEVNEDKTSIIDVGCGQPFNFLGYRFQMFDWHKSFSERRILARPMRSKRTEFLRSIRALIKRSRFKPIQEVTREINPRVQGWINYFSWGHPQKDIAFIKWQIDTKVRKFASRQRNAKRGGKGWTAWSPKEVYGEFGLKRFNRLVKFRAELPARAAT